MRRADRQGVPASFAPHRVFSTTDPAVAEQLGSPVLGRHRLSFADGAGHDFCSTLHAVALGAVTVGYLHLTASADIELSASAPRFLVVQAMTGPAAVRSRGVVVVATPSRAVVVQPGRPSSMRCAAGTTTRVIVIDRAAMLDHLGRLLARVPDGTLVFDAEMDLAAGGSSRWNLAVQVLHAELSEPGSLLRAGVANRPLEEFLMSALLYGQPSTYSEELIRPGSQTGSRAVTAAKLFIEAHLSERLTVGTLASVAGVSPRALQAAFRAQLRTTPTAYVRGLRLDQVRSDLLGAAGDPPTVTDVAIRWGFSHLGRFATEYRGRFGESPSETLRRSGRTVPGGPARRQGLSTSGC